MLASSGERIPPWGVPVPVFLDQAVLAEDACSQERLYQGQDPLVPDTTPAPGPSGPV